MAIVEHPPAETFIPARPTLASLTEDLRLVAGRLKAAALQPRV